MTYYMKKQDKTVNKLISIHLCCYFSNVDCNILYGYVHGLFCLLCVFMW